MKKLGRIIWAADPLEDKGVRAQAIRVLRDLVARTGASVEPVYILSDGLLGLSLTKADLTRHFKAASQRALEHLVKEAGIETSTPATVLVVAPSSRSSATAALDRYAKDRGAELILVSSHGRHGVKRVVLGSFAETLTLHARTPVLISGPKTAAFGKLDRILFPTDFSPQSRRAFEKVLKLAAKLDAAVTVFSVGWNPFEPLIRSGTSLLGGGFVTTQGFIKPDYGPMRKQAAAWAAEARKKRVRADAAFDLDSTSVALSIVDHARRKKPGLIAMASESSAGEAALLGSVGREVAREAPCPVWFLRS